MISNVLHIHEMCPLQFYYLKYFYYIYKYLFINAIMWFEVFVPLTFYINKDENSQVWERRSKVFKRHSQPHQLNLERFHSKNTSRFNQLRLRFALYTAKRCIEYDMLRPTRVSFKPLNSIESLIKENFILQNCNYFIHDLKCYKG